MDTSSTRLLPKECCLREHTMHIRSNGCRNRDHRTPVNEQWRSLSLYKRARGDIQHSLEGIVGRLGITAVVARQGSAFLFVFHGSLPSGLARFGHASRFRFRYRFRRNLVDRGIYVFPQPTKQCSLSAAHSKADVEEDFAQMEHALNFCVETNHSDVR